MLGNSISLFSIRRALEASLRFCTSNAIDPSTRLRIVNYMDYLDSELGNSNEMDDFRLLPPALRVEFVAANAVPALIELLPLYMDPRLNWVSH